MRGGTTRRGIAIRIRRLERRLGFSDIPLHSEGEQNALPCMQWQQFCAVFVDPEDSQHGPTPPSPSVVLKDARLVRWLRQVYPDRLRDLKQAHAAGEPAPPWRETSTPSTNRKISAKTNKQAVAVLSQPEYAGFGPTLAAEYLEQRHGIRVGRETLRGWMSAAGLWKPHRRKARRPHLWRPRRSRRGELVQWDTSEHDWLEGRGDQKLYLIGMIDDASSELLARFVPHDSSEETRRLLRSYLEKNGRPVAVYTDRAGMFVNTPKNSAGEDPKTLPPTQIGRALEELGIEPITAYSPQAKGRVERSFGTAQDRLVKGLRLAGATTIEQANAYLENEFLPWWNATLRVAPAHPDEAHRKLGPEHNLDSALSHVEARRVANDYTIRFQGKRYQIDRKAIVPGLRGGQVRLESGLDGKLVARFGKHELALRRCLTRPESKDAEKKAAAAEKAPGPVPRRKGSDWMKDFDLKKSPPLWLVAQASGIRRDQAQADALS